MIQVSRSYRRLIYLLLAVPVMVVVLAIIYQAGMTHLEGIPRSFGDGLGWAAETLTTTGYGRDSTWTHPLMQLYVVAVQFVGVLMIFLVFPIFLLPFIEERFEARLPTSLPRMSGQVLIYRYGPAITSLLDDLAQEGVKTVIFEEDEAMARRLREREFEVVLGNLDAEDPDLRNLVGARGMVLNGMDNQNAAMALSARYHGYEGPIIALVTIPIEGLRCCVPGRPRRSPPTTCWRGPLPPARAVTSARDRKVPNDSGNVSRWPNFGSTPQVRWLGRPSNTHRFERTRNRRSWVSGSEDGSSSIHPTRPFLSRGRSWLWWVAGRPLGACDR